MDNYDVVSNVLKYDNTIWTYIIKHLFDIYEFPSYKKNKNKEDILGSVSVNQSIIFNPILRSFYQESSDHSLIIDFDKVSEITSIKNRAVMLSEFEEQKLVSLYVQLKRITSVLLLTCKDVSMRYVNALHYDWNVRSKYNVLKMTIDLMDRYFGMLKWGPYWSSLDNIFTCHVFPKHVSSLKNVLIQRIQQDEFEDHFFHEAIFTLDLYSKERNILDARKAYFCFKRSNILQSFKFDTPSYLVENNNPQKQTALKSCHNNSEIYIKNVVIFKLDDTDKSRFAYAIVNYRDVL